MRACTFALLSADKVLWVAHYINIHSRYASLCANLPEHTGIYMVLGNHTGGKRSHSRQPFQQTAKVKTNRQQQHPLPRCFIQLRQHPLPNAFVHQRQHHYQVLLSCCGSLRVPSSNAGKRFPLTRGVPAGISTGLRNSLTEKVELGMGASGWIPVDSAYGQSHALALSLSHTHTHAHTCMSRMPLDSA